MPKRGSPTVAFQGIQFSPITDTKITRTGYKDLHQCNRDYAEKGMALNFLLLWFLG